LLLSQKFANASALLIRLAGAPDLLGKAASIRSHDRPDSGANWHPGGDVRPAAWALGSVIAGAGALR